MEQNKQKEDSEKKLNDRQLEKEKKRLDCCNVCRGTMTLEMMKDEVRQMGGSLGKNPFRHLEPFDEATKIKIKELQDKVNKGD